MAGALVIDVGGSRWSVAAQHQLDAVLEDQILRGALRDVFDLALVTTSESGWDGQVEATLSLDVSEGEGRVGVRRGDELFERTIPLVALPESRSMAQVQLPSFRQAILDAVGDSLGARRVSESQPPEQTWLRGLAVLVHRGSGPAEDVRWTSRMVDALGDGEALERGLNDSPFYLFDARRLPDGIVPAVVVEISRTTRGDRRVAIRSLHVDSETEIEGVADLAADDAAGRLRHVVRQEIERLLETVEGGLEREPDARASDGRGSADDGRDSAAGEARFSVRAVERIASRSEIVDEPADALARRGVESIITQAERIIETLPDGSQRHELERLRGALVEEWHNPNWDPLSIERYSSRIARAVAAIDGSIELDPTVAEALDPEGEVVDAVRETMATQEVGTEDAEEDAARTNELLDEVRSLSDKVEARLHALDESDRAADLAERVDRIEAREPSGPLAQFAVSFLSSALVVLLASGGGSIILAGLIRVLIAFYRFSGL